MAATVCAGSVSIPPHLTKLAFSSIRPQMDFSDKFIQGRVVKCWPLTSSGKKDTDLRKYIIKEDGDASAAEATVFFIGIFATMYQDLQADDVVALSNIYVESRQGTSADDAHGVNIIVDKSRSNAYIWVISRSKNRFRNQSVDTENKSSRAYNYSLLRTLKTDTVVNVYGVVKFFKLPKKSRGSDYSMVISIVDPSLEMNEKITCNLFANINDLPMIEKNGDIIRFHRLKIGSWNGNIQGTNGPGFSWVIFRKLDPMSPHNVNSPITRALSYTVTNEDVQKVQELSAWAQSEQFSQIYNKICTFSKVECGDYFDITCQVVNKAVLEPGTAILLQVWDGTLLTSPFVKADLSELSVIRDEGLERRAADYLVDVFVFDDHFPQALAVTPGAFVTFRNLHAAKCKEPESDPTVTQRIEFALHGGTSYGRGLKVTPTDAESVKKVLECMQNIQQDDDDDDSDTAEPASKRPRVCTETEAGMQPALSERPAQSHTPTSSDRQPETVSNTLSQGDRQAQTVSNAPTQGDRQAQTVSNAPTQGDRQAQVHSVSSSSEDSCLIGGKDLTREGPSQPDSSPDASRCMLVTASVITDHHHIKRTSIMDVNSAAVPAKHRICAQLIDYKPRTNDPLVFFKVYCPVCNFLSPLPKSCIRKSHDGQSDSDSAGQTDSDMSVTLTQTDERCQKWQCLFLRTKRKKKIKCRQLVEVDGEPVVDGELLVDKDISEKELSDLRRKGHNIKMAIEDAAPWHETAMPLYERADLPCYACPTCQAQQTQHGTTEDFEQILDYVYMLRLLLDDNKDWLTVKLWGEQAEKFFNGVPAKEAVKSREVFDDITGQLTSLCPDRSSRQASAWLECCVQSHHTSNQAAYFMFDTQLASIQ